jgi:DNA polymerase-3 subunit beta
MKASVLQPNLNRGLALVKRAVASRPSLPVLSHVLLACNGQADGLTLTGTDLERYISCRICARVEEAGSITVPARLVADLVGTLPQERVDLTMNGSHQVHLQCDRNEADVNGIVAEEFPELREWQGDDEISLLPDVLKSALDQVTFAASREESRPILTGVLFAFEGNTLTLAAADGFRMAVRTVLLDGAVREPVSTIVPAISLIDVSRICADEEEPVKLQVTETDARFVFAANAGKNEGVILGIEARTQLLQGNYVNYAQIIPDPEAIRTTVVVDRRAFLRAIKPPKIFARSSAHILVLDVQDGKLTISAEGVEEGAGTTQVEATVEGEPMRISFNAVFLEGAVNSVDSTFVALDLIDHAHAAKVRPADQKPADVERHVHVLMPMVTREMRVAAARAAEAQEAAEAESKE